VKIQYIGKFIFISLAISSVIVVTPISCRCVEPLNTAQMASFCPQDTPEAAQNRETEKLLQEEAMKDRMVHKLLLLGNFSYLHINNVGAGGSGKSTIFKQMKIINDEGYSDEEMKVFANVVRVNIYDIFSLVLFMCEEQNLVPGSQHDVSIFDH
jgi:hypothetical protein